MRVEKTLAEVYSLIDQAFTLLENIRPAGGFVGNLYPAPSPRVSRKDIKGFVDFWMHDVVRICTKDEVAGRRTGLVDAICRLIGIPEERPKVWCGHFKLDPLGWLFLPFGSAPLGKYDSWSVCPICSKPRPTARGGE